MAAPTLGINAKINQSNSVPDFMAAQHGEGAATHQPYAGKDATAWLPPPGFTPPRLEKKWVKEKSGKSS